MKIKQPIINPLIVSTILLVMAALWLRTFNEANEAARLAAAKIKPWTELTRSQMSDVAACEDKAQLQAQPNTDPRSRDAMARKLAFECSADYLLAQPLISSAVGAQVLAHAAASALYDAVEASSKRLDAKKLAKFYAKAAANAQEASYFAAAADSELAKSCDGFMSASACSVVSITPDRPERRLADPMREFELDLHAQYWIATHPSDELLHTQTGISAKLSPAYLYARDKVFANH
jgi:hypothetical protein